MAQRFDMRRESDDTWTVIEVATGQPIIAVDLPMAGMSVDDADDMVDLLNRLHRDKGDVPKQ